MIVLIAITVLLVGLIHWYLNGSYSFWKKKGVPYPSPTFLAGNIGQSLILRKNIGVVYEDIYNNFKDCKYVGFYKLLNPALLLIDVNLIKELVVKEFDSFHDNDIEIDENTDPLFGKNPFVLKGNRWKVVRTQITSAITSGKIKQMFTFMSNVSTELVKYLINNPEARSNDGLNAKELSQKFTTDVVAACAFGLDGKSFTDPNAEFKLMGEKLFSPGIIDSIKATIVFALPFVAKMFKIGAVPQNVQNWFIGTLEQTIKYREENNIVRNDYLDLMISLKSKPGEYEFTNMDVMAQSMTFFSDGMETSAIALSFAMHEIAKHSDVQIKLREEINNVLAKHNGEMTYEAIQEMQYLDMVISETLRLYPPAPFLPKRCTKQFVLPPARGEGTGPGVVIEPGMSVVIPTYGIHHDAKFYPDPEKFDPERFNEEAKKNRPKFAFIPFGEGPRMCLGFRFALIQIKAALVATVSNFEIKVNPKTSHKLEIDPFTLLTAAKGGIWLNFNKLDK